MKKNSSTFLLILLLLLGLSLLLYPTVSEYWNSLHASRAIASYSEEVSSLDAESYDRLWQEARAFNDGILQRPNVYLVEEEEKERYRQTLNLSGNGIMGYIEIPEISSTLPIYHGTDDAVLQIAVGHLTGPVCRWEAKAPTVCCPDTGVCPVPSCFQIWIRSQREIPLFCGFWMKF